MDIQFSNLKKQYGDTTVLDIENLTINQGELVGLVAVSYTHLTLPTKA